MQIRDRVRELRRVRASELRPSARNWRTHPASQKDALQGILAEVGYADALLARELPDGSLELIDGHLRAETTPDQEVPVLVLDLDEAEAVKLLACLDPLAAMAGADAAKLESLLAEVSTGSPALEAMLGELAAASPNLREPADPANDPAEEWQGMPEFEHEDLTAFRKIVVHFKDQAAVDAFAALTGQPVTSQTKFLWFPPQEVIRYGIAE